MTPSERKIGQHVGETLSGYIDGELTQQERQRLEMHLIGCAECTSIRDGLLELRREVGDARLSMIGEDRWRESMDDTAVRASRGIGWLLVAGGFLGVAGMGVAGVVIDPSITLFAKLAIGATYGGFAFLFISVLRQRLIERKSDRYKDVEI